MARRHHSLLPLILTGTLALAACSSTDDTQDRAAEASADAVTTEAPVTTAAPEPAPTTEAIETTEVEEIADEGAAEELFPDVLDASGSQDADGTWTINATLSSPYDSPERYADAWRVVGPDGAEYGIRVLGHDHASEQPFTRSHSGIEIPEGVETVTIQGRDQVSGWGGDTFELTLQSS